MENVFLKLFNMSISAGWLILAVLLLRVVLKKAPKWIRCILWGLVGIRLICPISFESVFSLIPSAETVPQEILYAEEPAIHSGVAALNTVVNPILSESMAPTAGASVNPMQVVTHIATYVWLAGLVAMVIYAAVSYLRIYKKVSASMSFKDNIFLCDYIETPFILGIFRPRIYLPSTLEEEKTVHVIAHEKAHLKRHDHWWKPLGFVLLTVYWFNPFIWLAYVLLCKDIELASDERVIKELGEAGKKSYSDTLLSCSVPRKMIVACPLAFGEVGVKERVSSVLNYKKPAFWILVVAVVACIIVAVCFLTNPKENFLYASDPFGHTYGVEEVVYDDVRVSAIYPIHRPSQYYFTADYCLMAKGHIDLGDPLEDWTQLGNLQEVELSKANFDKYFFIDDGAGWKNNLSAAKLRRGNEYAWQLIREKGDEGNLSYYLLQQENGQVYLVCWYYDAEQETDAASDESNVRWVLKLMRTDYITCAVESQGETTTIEMKWYPDGQYDFDDEELPVATVDIRGNLVLTVNDDIYTASNSVNGTKVDSKENSTTTDGDESNAENTLTIGEDFYTSPGEGGTAISRETYTLRKNNKGTYKLAVERKSALGNEQAIYYVPYGEGKYVFKVVFPGEESFELIGKTYAETKCLYMSPISSSIFPLGSGKTYEFMEDAVIVRNKAINNLGNKFIYVPGDEPINILGDESAETGDIEIVEHERSISIEKWQWQEFPYTDEEWAALFFGRDTFEGIVVGGEKIHSRYEEILYQPIDSSTFLLKVDGDLWIVDLSYGGKEGDRIWSIFVLEPIDA